VGKNIFKTGHSSIKVIGTTTNIMVKESCGGIRVERRPQPKNVKVGSINKAQKDLGFILTSRMACFSKEISIGVG
jgi:hypothetical protein